MSVVISGTGLFTPKDFITNEELVESYNKYADIYNSENKKEITTGELEALTHSDATFTFPQTVVLRYTFQEIGVADKAAEGYRRWFVARLKLLEQSLESREYLCSDRFTIADICVSYAIYLAKTLQIEEAFKPNIKRWTDMLFDRDGFKRAVAHRYDNPE